MSEPLNINPPKRVQMAAIVALICLSLFLLVKTLSSLNDMDSVGQNTISVTGKGETFAVPDIATFSFSVVEEGSTLAEAQKKAAEKNNAAIKYLKEAGVADKDIKTESYTGNPKYEYNQVVCVRYPCPSSQKLVGYESSQTISVKVRDTDKASDILTGIGKAGVTDISALSFTIDNDDVLKAEARKIAIEDAKSKADTLAKDLGVKLGKVASFTEDAGGYPYPVYAMEAKTMSAGAPSVAPDLPKGENKITVNVTVTYKIR